LSHCNLFSNHGNVLLVLSEDPDARLRDVAARVGITERAVQKIVRDLQDDGLLNVSKHGRRNRYRINTRKALRHPLDSHRTVGSLLTLIRSGKEETSTTAEQNVPRAVRASVSGGEKGDSEKTPVHLPDAAQEPTRAEPSARTEASSAPPATSHHDEPESADASAASAEETSEKSANKPSGSKKKKHKKSKADDHQGSLF
jgi:hypothetical protein